jgi:hypothetical protein
MVVIFPSPTKYLTTMNPAWKLVPLREVIIQAKNETMIISESLYKQITVRLNHKGVQQRALVAGGQVD